MRKIFEWIGGFALIAFSFYFTDQVSLLVASKSDLMQEIKLVSADYKIDAIDAVVNKDENTIIPGKFGRKVDSHESYLSMHEFGAFNENYLVYTPIKPKTSLADNKDKYITGGLVQNRMISIIIDHNKDVEKYFKDENLKYNSIAIMEDDLNSKIAEYINGASIKNDFKILNSKISDNKKICIKGMSDLKSCLKYDYYIVKPKLTLSNSNISEIKSQISSGNIVLVSQTTKLEYIKLILNEIKYKDLKLVYLSELISEA